LLDALEHLYAGGNDAVMLVGGTALAGYYAGHRRSDALDLFVRSPVAFEALRRRVSTLEDVGAAVRPQHTTPGFHRSLVELRGHAFTIDIVLDANVFRVGRSNVCDRVTVASLQTLLKCKTATLVSRCSEKDLYDLLWICTRDPSLTPNELVRLGREIDAGVDAEAVLIALTSTRLSESACAFALSGRPSANEIFREVASFKATLQFAFDAELRGEPAPALANTMQKLGKKRR
jgi:hypothetical protein